MNNNNNNNNHEFNIDDTKIRKSYQDYMDSIQVQQDFHQRLINIPNDTAAKALARKQKLLVIKRFSQVAAGILIILSLGFLSSLFIGLGSTGTKDSAPMEDNYKDEPAKPAPESPKASPEDKDMDNGNTIVDKTYTDWPIPLTADLSSTYTRFLANYKSNQGVVIHPVKPDNPILDPKEDHSQDIKALLISKLPKKLVKLSTEKELHLTVQNNHYTLTLFYSPLDSKLPSKLMVNVHPILDFEKDLIVEATENTKYSLNADDNPELPPSIKEYKATLLYPIFSIETLTKDIIYSREWKINDSLSFGVYQDGYVITYDAIGISPSKLSQWILD